MDDYPGNSREARRPQPTRAEVEPPERNREEETRPKVKKVVTSRVVERKRSLGTRFRDTFLAGGKEVGGYIFQEVLVPSLKEVVIETITQFVENALRRPDQEVGYRGRPRWAQGYRPSGRSGYIQYNNSSGSRSSSWDRERDARRRDEPPYSTRRERSGFELKEVIFLTHHDADNVIRELEHVASEYGHASVVDYYDAIGMTHEYTDERWGWYGNTLSRAHVKRLAHQEFILVLPPPERLDP